MVTYPYPGSPINIFGDVYRKLGEGLEDIENKFICVGNIEGLDVFIRSTPRSLLEDNIDKFRKSEYFNEGVCLSATTSRWDQNFLELQLENWSYSDLKFLGKNGGYNFRVTGSNPLLRSPVLNLDANDYYNLYVRILAQPPIECNTSVMYFTRTDALNESEDRSIPITFEPSTDFQFIVVTVRNHPEWRDTIHEIRIDPVCGMNSDGTPIKFEIDSVTFGQDRH